MSGASAGRAVRARHGDAPVSLEYTDDDGRSNSASPRASRRSAGR